MSEGQWLWQLHRRRCNDVPRATPAFCSAKDERTLPYAEGKGLPHYSRATGSPPPDPTPDRTGQGRTLTHYNITIPSQFKYRTMHRLNLPPPRNTVVYLECNLQCIHGVDPLWIRHALEHQHGLRRPWHRHALVTFGDCPTVAEDGRRLRLTLVSPLHNSRRILEMKAIQYEHYFN